MSTQPFTLDIRVGCVAVYAGEKRHCLDGFHSDSFIFYRPGYWKKGQWNVRVKDVTLARKIVAALNNHNKLIVALSRIQGLAGQVLREPKWALQNCDSIEEIARAALAKAGVTK